MVNLVERLGQWTARPVEPQDVLLLHAVRGGPSISVLMTITPGPVMTVSDRIRLQDLVGQVSSRLRRLRHGEPSAVITLNRLADSTAGELVDRAVGLFVGDGVARALRLGVPVADRAVVEETFVTRDVVRALQHRPRHLVLMLSSHEARLFGSVNGALRLAATAGFPNTLERSRRSHAGGCGLRQASTDEFLQGVNRRLVAYQALYPSPVVLAGPMSILATFLDVDRGVQRLAGMVRGNFIGAQLADLAAVTVPVLRRYLASREQGALYLIEEQTVQRRVASGLERAWLASRAETVEMLAVEEDLSCPARVSPDGLTESPTTDLGDPEVISDAVDELIEHVLIRCDWIAMVRSGELARHDGVALTTANRPIELTTSRGMHVPCWS